MLNDFPPTPRPEGLGLADVVDMLRSDAAAAEARGQRLLDDLERRMLSAIEGTRVEIGAARSEFAHYAEVHAGEHGAIRTTSEIAHKRFDDFIAASSLDQARRDGALGVIRYIADIAGRNWKAIVAAALAIAAASGAIQVDLAVGG